MPVPVAVFKHPLPAALGFALREDRVCDARSVGSEWSDLQLVGEGGGNEDLVGKISWTYFRVSSLGASFVSLGTSLGLASC